MSQSNGREYERNPIRSSSCDEPQKKPSDTTLLSPPPRDVKYSLCSFIYLYFVLS